MRARLLLVAILLTLASACLIDIDYGGTRFRCQEDGRCPEGYDCVAGFCEETGGDAGPPGDASGLDAAAADGAPMIDAAQ